MEEQRTNMLIPALIGGGVAGVLSAVPVLNCLCCLWIIGGGIIAVFFLNKDTPKPLTMGDGTVVGIFSGLVATAADFLISIPLAPITNKFIANVMERLAQYAEEMPAGWETWLEKGGAEVSVSLILLGILINAVIFSVLGALGGIIGVSIFKRDQARQGDKSVVDIPEESKTVKDSDHNQS
ncbi:MAG: hypothetical protein GF421_12240 [Candidatus Aminicenantes bacterium]|nr:hypothetical protein [Candidatus Aminicenantes bacterium]